MYRYIIAGQIIKVLEAPEEILMVRDMGIEEDIIELAKSPSHVSILSDVSVEQEIRATHFRSKRGSIYAKQNDIMVKFVDIRTYASWKVINDDSRFVSKSFRSGRIAKTYRNVSEKLHGDSGINAGKNSVKKKSRSPEKIKIFPFQVKLDFQIDNEQSLAHLIEIRNVTVLCISIIPFDCTVFELISLTDEIYKTIQKYPRSNIYIYVLLKLFLKN